MGVQAIIGTIGDLDAYQLPDAKGHTAFMRHILGVTQEERQARRDEVLATTLQDFRCGQLPTPREMACGGLVSLTPAHASVPGLTGHRLQGVRRGAGLRQGLCGARGGSHLSRAG